MKKTIINKSSLKKIYINVIYLLILFIMLGLLYCYYIPEDYNSESDVFNRTMILVNLIFYIIVIILNTWYLKLEKNEYIYLMNIYFVENIFFLIAINPNSSFNYEIEMNNIQNTLLFMNYFINIFIFLGLILNLKKIFKIKNIENFYILSLYILCFVSIILFANIGKQPESVTDEILYIFIVLNIILTFFAAIKFLKKVSISIKNIYFSIGLFMLILSFKYLFQYAKLIYDIDINTIYVQVFLFYTRIYLYSLGIMSQIRFIKKQKQTLKSQFSNYLDVTNNMEEIEICIFDSDKRCLFLNKLFRENYDLDFTDRNLNFKFRDLLETKYNNLDRNTRENISKSLIEMGEWDGIVSTGNENKYMKINKIKNSTGKEVYISEFDLDKERVKIRKQLEEKEKIHKLIIENIQEMIIITDKSMNIEYINDMGLNYLGYKEEEILNHNIKEFVKYDRLNYIKKVDRKEYLGKNFCITKNRGEFEVESIRYEITDFEEGIKKWIYISKNLEFFNQFRFFKMRYDEIKEYQQLKNKYFVSLSHELKTPLNIFYSTIQLLDVKSNNENIDFNLEYKKYNESLKTNFFRMLKMVNNLIDLSKLNDGFLKSEYGNYDIISVVENTTLSVVPYSNKKGIEIVFDTDSEEEIIKCNPENIERIILNLLSNAIKFTDRGGKILVNMHCNENRIRISVKDNGIGIDKSMQKQIFNEFTQVDKSLKRNHEGSGIGLSIVKKLVELDGGKIYLSSREGKGSNFIIYFPNKKLEQYNDNKQTEYKTDKQKVKLELSDIYDTI